MKARVAGRLAAVSAIVLGGVLASVPAAAQKIENSYICVFKKDAVAKGAVGRKASEMARANGGQVKRTYSSSIRGFSANISAQGAARIAANNPNIAFCEQDQIATTVQRGKPGSGGGSTGQTTPWGITRVGGGIAGSYATAWVIDSGVDLDHPDLNVDVARSRNFTTERDADDGNGHGTHVAGTIAALDNAIGVVGVAPGAPVVGLKALNRRGSGSYSDIIAAVDHVGANGASGDVCNMSLGGGASQALDDAIVAAAQASGVRFTLAAGNEGQNANNVSPARTNGTGIYTISAFAQGDSWASFSNFANPPIDYAGPGVSVYSTYKGGGYATLSGTSMAAPHVAGLLLLGALRSGGTVAGDPDGTADTIAIR